MIAPTQIRKPENWQDFEKLCKKLWGEIWDCSDTIKRNGRSGQNQCGIDVYGIPKDQTQYYGIQCKGKDDYTKSQLTKKEIDEELSRGLNFKPQLKRMIFATTANKDVCIEEHIRTKNIEYISKGLFEVDICSWEDIVDLLEEKRDTYNWYINNCQYKDSSDVEIYFDWGKEFEINPQYIRTTKVYHKKIKVNNSILELTKRMGYVHQPLMTHQDYGVDYLFGKQKKKIDYRWCSIPINIKNTGNTVIEDYKLLLIFDSDETASLDDKFRYYNPGPLFDQKIVSQENIHRKKQQQVFLSSEYNNVIEYIPLRPILVQDDDTTFKIGVKPKDGVKTITVQWELRSRNYKKEGVLTLNVIPHFEDKKEYIEVETEEEVKEKEIITVAKIEEKY